MKLSRSELETGFENKLFKIKTNNLADLGIRFFENHISCILTSIVVDFGFIISGNIETIVEYNCDRCMDCFNNHLKIPLKLSITRKKKIDEQKESDIVLFPDHDNAIDISNILTDFIVLDKPMKLLCSKKCKGLCKLCGTNLNYKSCDCLSFKENNSWEALKKITLD